MNSIEIQWLSATYNFRNFKVWLSFLNLWCFLKIRKKGEGKTYTSRKKVKRKKHVDPSVNPGRLRHELELYRQNGVSLSLEGCPSSPSEIVRAHLVAESGGYMRDYEQDEKGAIRKIDFDKVHMF